MENVPLIFHIEKQLGTEKHNFSFSQLFALESFSFRYQFYTVISYRSFFLSCGREILFGVD
jgi:hypothetical protein